MADTTFALPHRQMRLRFAGAVNYHADKMGTGVVYDTVAKAVRSVRESRALDNWSDEIKRDYKKRSKK